jgi:hypothetical protein
MQEKDGNNGEQELVKRSNKSRSKLDYLADWYIGVSKRRGWPEVVRLLAQYPDDEQELKQLIKKKLGK